MVELVEVGKVDDFKEGKLTPLNIEGFELMGTAINGEIIIASRICTHKYFDLTKGHYSSGYVTCQLHTSTFDLEDGSAMNPPATESLSIYETEINDGIVFIDIDK